jgi:branched-chain amino acid transport system ATP-binding protein
VTVTGATLLDVTDLRVTYDRVAVALHGISLSVPHGGIVAVLGANGAGKTTTLRAIGGLLRSETGRVSGGKVRFDGASLVRKPPHWIARRGVGIVPERNKVFASLTVQDNLGSVPVLHGSERRKAMEEFVLDLFPALGQRLRNQAGLLSGGERQMLAVARALLLEPKILLADELSFGIAPVMVGRLLDALRTVNREQGISILLVEQNAAAAFELATHVYVLDNGRVSMHGTPTELEARTDIQQAYFGLEAALEGAV